MHILKSKLILFNLIFVSSFVYSQTIWDPVSETFSNSNFNVNIQNYKTTGWERIGPTTNDILNFSFDYSNMNIIYAASRDSGVFKTIDGGGNWMLINNGLPYEYIRSIAVHPKKSNLILAGTFHGGLFMSEDSGNSWFKIDYINDTTILDIKFNEFNSDTVLVGTLNNGIFRSFDAGLTWQNISIGKALKIYFDPIIKDRVYYISNNLIYKSDDLGNTWSIFFSATQNNIISLQINPQNSNVIYMGTNPADSLYKSIDGGENWQRLKFINIVTDILINRLDTSQIFVGCPDIGVYSSSNSGFSWLSFNENIFSYKIIKIKQHILNPNIIFTSTNEGGIQKLELLTSIDSEINSIISIYPNPTSNYLYIKGLTDVAKISIYDISGKLVINNINSDNIIDLNLIQNGIYILKIETKEEVISKFFLKQ